MLASPRTDPSVTFLADVDARAKIAISMMASIMTITMTSSVAQGALFVFSALYALTIRRPKILCLAYLLVAALLLLAIGFAMGMRLFIPRMSPIDIPALAVPFLRLLVMVNVVLPLALTTRLQPMLRSLKSLRLPFCIYIPLAVMIRFIPTFMADIRQIAEALRIRGYRVGIKQFFLHPALIWRFVSIPLLIRSLKTSEALGIAAELKGLGATRQFTPFHDPVWTRKDTVLVALGLAVCVMAVILNSVFKAQGRLH